MKEKGKKISLPVPQKKGDMSLEETLEKRRSLRAFSKRELKLEEISQLLWAAQGNNHPEGLRTCPSAGATYPIETYFASQNGLFHYLVDQHKLEIISPNNLLPSLCHAALEQSFIKNASIVIIFTAISERTTERYGERGIRYIYMEAGHAAQNVHLQAESLGLGSTPVGAFDDKAICSLLEKKNSLPLYLLAIGDSNN